MSDYLAYPVVSFDSIALPGERWSARDLMPLLGYDRWENFESAVQRASLSITNQNIPLTSHVRDATKLVDRPQGGSVRFSDFELSRFACYLVAMNGDPRKPEVAAAQAYFAVKTREAEASTPAALSRREILTMALEAEERAESEYAARLEAEQHARALEAPASAWSHLAESSGDYGVADAAKVLSRDANITIGRDRLFKFMQGEGWIFRDTSTAAWKAYQTQVNTGRLVEKLGRPFLHEPTGEMRNPAPTIRITTKGLAELHKRLGGEGQMSLLAVSA